MVIAAVLVVWLRNTLGTTHGEERDRSTELNIDQTAQKVLNEIGNYIDESAMQKLKSLDIEDDAVRTRLQDLMREDSSFDPKQFILGAGDAFAMIVESFAKGDLQSLKELTAPVVYGAFEQAVKLRMQAGETIQTEVHAIKTSRVLDVKRAGHMVFIKMRFVADETCVTRNREGTILGGHPDKITTMNDVWTFGRDMRSKDPTWYLFETSDDVVEEHKTPVPDSGSTTV